MALWPSQRISGDSTLMSRLLGVPYDGREYDEGTNVGWRDAVVALAVLLRYRFSE